MRTDDFSLDLIRRLRERVAHRCSNPDCRIVTTAAGLGEMGVNSIGRAAHISAASAGAARYDASMSSKRRKSIENAIWLCGNCHIKVDNDEAAFPTLLLNSWKLRAEEFARRELGQKLITDADSQDTLIAALGGTPKHLPRTAIANVIAAGEKELQQLDARFQVRTTYVDKTLVHELTAVGTVPVSFQVMPSSDGGEFFADLKKMIDHGTAVTLPARHVSASGSPLITHVLDITTANQGTLTFTPAARAATLKLVLSHPTNGQVRAFNDMPGRLNFGRKSITFSGGNCDGALHISFQKSFQEGSALSDGQFFIDLKRWNGRDIRHIPYHQKLDELFRDLADGWHLEFELEIDGMEFLSGRFNDSRALRPYISSVNVLLAYSMRARALARHLNERIEFRDDISFTKEQHKALIDALEIFDLKRVYERAEMTSNVTCCLVLTDESAASVLQQRKTPAEIVIRSAEEESIRIFDRLLTLPPLEIVLQAVLPRLLGRATPARSGQKIRLEFEPADGFKCIYRYGSSRSPNGVGAELSEPRRISTDSRGAGAQA